MVQRTRTGYLTLSTRRHRSPAALRSHRRPTLTGGRRDRLRRIPSDSASIADLIPGMTFWWWP